MQSCRGENRPSAFVRRKASAMAPHAQDMPVICPCARSCARLDAKPPTTDLFQASRKGGEGGLETGAEPLDHRKDRERNAGGDQTIFDGGRTRFVFQEGFERAQHAYIVGDDP